MTHRTPDTEHPLPEGADVQHAEALRPRISESFIKQGVRLDQLQNEAGFENGVRLAASRIRLGIGNTEFRIQQLRPPDVEEAFHLQVPEGVALITHDPKQDAYQPITPILIPSGESMVLGRETVAGLKADPEVSRQHVEVGCTEDGEVWLKHVGTTNGTRLS